MRDCPVRPPPPRGPAGRSCCCSPAAPRHPPKQLPPLLLPAAPCYSPLPMHPYHSHRRPPPSPQAPPPGQRRPPQLRPQQQPRPQRRATVEKQRPLTATALTASAEAEATEWWWLYWGRYRRRGWARGRQLLGQQQLRLTWHHWRGVAGAAVCALLRPPCCKRGRGGRTPGDLAHSYPARVYVPDGREHAAEGRGAGRRDGDRSCWLVVGAGLCNVLCPPVRGNASSRCQAVEVVVGR